MSAADAVLYAVPAMAVSTYAQALARAAEILGGVAALSDYLQIPQATVMRWIAGEEVPTYEAFLGVVDLLLEHDLGKFGNGKSNGR